MYIIAGLGNPSAQYDKTRHNVGFEVIKILADRFDIATDFIKHKAVCGKGSIEGMRVMLAMPQTYMNRSGDSVRELADRLAFHTVNYFIQCFRDTTGYTPAQYRKRFRTG